MSYISNNNIICISVYGSYSATVLTTYFTLAVNGLYNNVSMEGCIYFSQKSIIRLLSIPLITTAKKGGINCNLIFYIFLNSTSNPVYASPIITYNTKLVHYIFNVNLQVNTNDYIIIAGIYKPIPSSGNFIIYPSKLYLTNN